MGSFTNDVIYDYSPSVALNEVSSNPNSKNECQDSNLIRICHVEGVGREVGLNRRFQPSFVSVTVWPENEHCTIYN